MTAGPPQGVDWFTAPEQVNHRRYEALRAFFVDGLTHAQAAERFGYTRWGMVNLVREYRAGRLQLFTQPRKPGPPGVAPAKDRARARVITLRRQGLSSYEISAALATEATPLNRTGVAEILRLRIQKRAAFSATGLESVSSQPGGVLKWPRKMPPRGAQSDDTNSGPVSGATVPRAWKTESMNGSRS